MYTKNVHQKYGLKLMNTCVNMHAKMEINGVTNHNDIITYNTPGPTTKMKSHNVEPLCIASSVLFNCVVHSQHCHRRDL